MTNRANKIDKKCVNLDMEYNFFKMIMQFFLFFNIFSKKTGPPLGIKWDAPNPFPRHIKHVATYICVLLVKLYNIIDVPVAVTHFPWFNYM